MYNIIQYVLVGLIILAALIFFIKRAKGVASGEAGCGCSGCAKRPGSENSCCPDKQK